MHERPRERLCNVGVAALSDAELLALLLGCSPLPNQTVVDLGREILQQTGGIQGLSHLGIFALQQLRGIGIAKGCRLTAAFELGRRAQRENRLRKVSLDSVAAVLQFLRGRFVGCQREELVVLLLDSRQQLLREVLITVGTTNCLSFHPRDLFNAAVRDMATALIMVHNHPGGDPTPSKADIELTKRCQQIGQLLGVPLMDHMIIGDGERYFSFCEAQLLGN